MSSESERGRGGLTRRGFVRTAAVGATAGPAVGGGMEAQEQPPTYRFGGEVQGWQGRAPAAIEGEQNPTIELEAGTEYEVVWENLDGAPHDFTLRDADGNVVVQSEQTSEQGATVSMTFTATPAMTQYICTIHPTTMVGDVEVTGELEDGGGIPLVPAALVGAIVLAFLSPLLFALFLFSRGRGASEPPEG